MENGLGSPMPSINQIVLVTVVLATCLACIWMVFFFGRRLQTSAYLRDSLVESASQQELRTPLRELHDRAVAGPLDPSKPPPDSFGPPAQLWTEHIYVSYQERFSDRSVFGEEEAVDAKQARLQALAECKAWEGEERARYERLRQEAEAEARRRAEKRIPKSMDISLLGGGWAFLLEFSTVIVIIFSLVVLAILRTLEGREISTILAAIAGYVLGKASAAATKGQVESSSGQSPSPASERPAGVTPAGGPN